MIGELVMRCFHARTNAHVLHLKTKSYAQHKALDEFYTDIVDITDRLAEAYQGAHGLIEDYPDDFKLAGDSVKLVEGLKEWIEANRYEAVFESETYLHNIIDELVALCATTLYKLKNLK